MDVCDDSRFLVCYSSVTSVDVCDDSRFLVCYSSVTSVDVCDDSSLLVCYSSVTSVDVCDDSSLLVCYSSVTSVDVCDDSSLLVCYSSVTSVDVCDDSSLLVCYSSVTSVDVCDDSSLLVCYSSVTSVDVCDDSSLLVCYSSVTSVDVCDDSSLLVCYSSVTSVDVCDDSSLLAAGFADSVIRVWSLTTSKLRGMKSPDDLSIVDKEAGMYILKIIYLYIYYLGLQAGNETFVSYLRNLFPFLERKCYYYNILKCDLVEISVCNSNCIPNRPKSHIFDKLIRFWGFQTFLATGTFSNYILPFLKNCLQGFKTCK